MRAVSGPIEADARAQGIRATDILTSCVRVVMEDREHQPGSSHSLMRVLALATIVWLGAIVVLAQHPGSTVAAQATGTPFYAPLVMVAPTPTPIPAPGMIVYERHIEWADNWEIYAMRALSLIHI